jgi:hypothetical protein
MLTPRDKLAHGYDLNWENPETNIGATKGRDKSNIILKPF